MYLVVPLVALALSSCRVFDYEQREPWRTEAEEKCLSEKIVQPSAFMEPESELDGRGACGMSHPFKVSAMENGSVGVTPTATLACPIIGAVDRWIAESVQPAAQTWFGEQVIEIHQISAYSCRTMNGQPGTHISEHAFGNALDVASFKLASGREIVIKDAWKRGSYEEQGFLHDIITDACERFTTVLGPGSNVFHYDHFHLDLSRRASGDTYCKPVVARLMPPSQNLYTRRTPPGYRQASVQGPQQGPYVVTRDSYSQPSRHNDDLPLGPGAPRYEPQPRMNYPSAAGTPMNVSPQPSYQPSQSPYGASPPPMQAPAYAPQPQPYYPAPDPYRPLPPRNVGAKLDTKDEIITGSIGKKERKKTLAKKSAQKPEHVARQITKPAPKAVEHSAAMTSGDLFSPVPMAKQNGTPSSADIGQATMRALKAN